MIFLETNQFQDSFFESNVLNIKLYKVIYYVYKICVPRKLRS